MINKGLEKNSRPLSKKTLNKKIHSYLGINYALSVEKSFRWSKARVNSSTITNNNAFGHVSPQIQQTFDLLNEVNDMSLPSSEQCLNLNVFTPVSFNSPNVTNPLPVMVWIHGGGFQIGSGALSAYNGKKLALAGNVIVVTLNYRLGALGFLRLCDVSKGTINGTGNEGLTDQITALTWIQQNISHYGGDKNNITLFGESAGAMSIACLLASPQANKLFHKAILQSGAAHSYSSIEKANRVAKEFIYSANSLGFSIEDFPSMATSELLNVQKQFLNRPEVYKQFGILPFCPVVDGELIPQPPFEAIKKGCANHIPILSGSNTDEWTLFAAMLNQQITSSKTLHYYLQPLMDKSLIPECLSLTDTLLSERQLERTPQNRLNDVLSQYWFTQPCHRLLINHYLSGGQSYRYKLGRKTVVESLGCTHITDIGFVFGNIKSSLHGTAHRVNELVDQIQEAWTEFAHFSDPSTKSIQWPIYGEDNKLSYVYFDHDSSYITEQDADSVSFWSQIGDQQLAEF